MTTPKQKTKKEDSRQYSEKKGKNRLYLVVELFFFFCAMLQGFGLNDVFDPNSKDL